MSDEQERLRAQKAQQLKRITEGFDPVAYGSQESKNLNDN